MNTVDTSAVWLEADLWDEQARIVEQLGQDALLSDMGVEGAAMYEGPFTIGYDELSRAVAMRFGEGKFRMQDIRDRLRAIAAAYEGNDARHLYKFKKFLQQQ